MGKKFSIFVREHSRAVALGVIFLLSILSSSLGPKNFSHEFPAKATIPTQKMAVNEARKRMQQERLKPAPSRGGGAATEHPVQETITHELRVSATAYTFTGHRTATGIVPYRGVVAVDPALIPIGTKLYVEGYGYAQALDTGGSIKGGKIDVFFPQRVDALRWGRRKVRVLLLK